MKRLCYTVADENQEKEVISLKEDFKLPIP